jgi:hypothetical protein
MVELEKSENRMQALTARGFLQADKFSWKDTARETLKVYEELYAAGARP